MEQKIKEEKIESNPVFVSNVEKRLESNQYETLFFEIRHMHKDKIKLFSILVFLIEIYL